MIEVLTPVVEVITACAAAGRSSATRYRWHQVRPGPALAEVPAVLHEEQFANLALGQAHAMRVIPEQVAQQLNKMWS